MKKEERGDNNFSISICDVSFEGEEDDDEEREGGEGGGGGEGNRRL